MSQPDTFVSIGTPFELPENEDDFVRKKPVPVHDQIAVDWKGRRRFHGAFTGGFSAGYFNTVGTQEGWAPKPFSSSNSERAGKYEQRPEDFMDDEDLGEFGIAPRHVSTKTDFTHPENRHVAAGEEEKRRNALDAHHSIIPGVAPLHDLVVPASQTVGARLLKKMGWREGQGVGPKQQRLTDDGSSRFHSPVQTKGETTDGSANHWAFAPRDSDVADMPALVGRHGLGYKGMDADRTAVLQNKTRSNPSKSLKITGQAFGVGAYEEEDADVYDVEDMSGYDQTMGASDRADPFFGWSGSHDQHLEGGDSLSAFAKAKHPNPPRKIFRGPEVPRAFKPYHQFKDAPPKSASEMGLVDSTMTSKTRGQLLGEQRLQDMSVLSLLAPEDRDRLAQAKHQVVRPSATTAPATAAASQKLASSPAASLTAARVPPQPVPPGLSSAGMRSAAGASLASRFSSSTIPAAAAAGPSHFKPYASDPDKQQRYEAVTAGKNYTRPAGMMEWEEQREREEFARASQLYRPLGGAMAARFTPAKGDDYKPEEQKETVLAEHVNDPKDQLSAARANMFGKLTRTTLEWHPDRLVCKRFNVPDPYPNSNFVGLLTDSVDKKANFLNMSFLTAQAQAQPADDDVPTDTAAAAPAADDSSSSNNAKELSTFKPVTDPEPGGAKSPSSTVSFTISTEPSKPRSRPAPTGPLSILNKKSSNRPAESVSSTQPSPVTTSSGGAGESATVTANSSKNTADRAGTASKEESMDVSLTTSSQPPTQAEAEVEEEKGPDRPSMDFFKAIFASDSEDAGVSTDSDSDSDGANAASSSGAIAKSVLAPESVQAAASTAGAEKKQTGDTGGDSYPSHTGSPPRHVFVPRNQQAKPQEAAAQSDESDDDQFGPALPPAMSTSTGTYTTPTSHGYVEPGKERSKAPKDKKHKKHKKKEKKAKKSKKSRHHQSRSKRYDSSTGESDSDDSGPLAQATQSKHSPVGTPRDASHGPAPSMSRPRAADFM
ncbi:G patch domain-containing protein 1-like isoform X2 [Sycon ciliatum]|uniref:G patch domain-containing protein 1-like isoform X2 n=1 Tax=Sycon ciliatum TaxID=27933 RepID=UPI0031F709DF